MPNYFYTAKSLEGKTEAGNLEAANEMELAKAMRSKGLILIRAVPEKEKKKFNLNVSVSILPVSLTEKIMMIRNLGVMISAGLSLVKSFDVLSRQARSQKFKKALLNIRDRVNKGESLSLALGKYPSIFSELFVNMIKVGEESGTLDEIFKILSLQLRKEHKLRSKIKNAMIYPSVILFVMAVVGVIVLVFVIPNLISFLKSINADIPIYTRMLIATGEFLTQKWYLVVSFVFLLILSVFLMMRTKPGKMAMDSILLRIPIISQIIKKNNSAFLIRSLSSLVAAGVSLTRALEISSKTVNNHYFRNAALDAEEKVKKGWKLSNVLKLYQNIFPFGVTEMVEIGEETGRSSDILRKLADFYEQEAINAVERLSALIEPALIIALGIGVGIFALSIIQPIYSSLQTIAK